MTSPVQPILVVLVYRGGDRFQRALDSIIAAERFFSRIILSVTASIDSPDMRLAENFRDRLLPRTEIICTGTELPTMSHQAFWIDYLARTGVKSTDWIYWLAYDDQVKESGLRQIVDEDGNWPIEKGTAYFGPWAMRHESPNELFSGPLDAELESWTSFPLEGPTCLPLAKWVAGQLLQPTYMQMSGSVVSFESHRRLISGFPRKKGPMRIEMATASAPNNVRVAEFNQPVSIIYGRSNSDRSNYSTTARKEDLHLVIWLTKYELRHPNAIPVLVKAAAAVMALWTRVLIGKVQLPDERWVVRGVVSP